MENNVTTLETSKKLKAAGFPQLEWKSSFYHWEPVGGNGWTVTATNSLYGFTRHNAIAAPTAQELADQLPDEYHKALTIDRSGDDETKWDAYYLDGDTGTAIPDMFGHGPTITEALAALWLALHETLPNNNVTKLEEAPDVK